MAGFGAGGAEKGGRGAVTAVAEDDFARFIHADMQNGHRICIKYPRGQKAGLCYRLRRFFAACAAPAFLQVLPLLPAEEKNRLEIAKLRAFKAAALPAAEILAAQNGFCVTADTGKNIAEILAALRRRDARLHDGLLVRCVQAVGRAHAAGFCVGRLDLRALFLAPREVGFSGFCDFPERAMPLAAAQLRDIWLALHAAAAAAADKDETLAQAFMAWRRQAGLEVLENLQANAGFFRLLLKPYKGFVVMFPGRRQAARLRVLQFLAANLGR